MAPWRQALAAWAALALAAAAISEEELQAAVAGDCGGQDCLQGKAAEALSLLQAKPRREDAAAAEDRLICEHYEVCQCESGPAESSTICKPGTCRYKKKLSHFNYCRYRSPRCTGWRHWPSWKDCQWANFGAAGEFPGENRVLTALPKKSLSPGLLSSLTSVTVYTDMDDTLTCSGGGFAGIDTTCEGTQKGKLYPGVAEFQLALTRGPSGALHPQLVVPLSARPRQLKAVLRIKANSPTNIAFKKVGGPDWGFNIADAIYGKMQDDLDFIDRGLTPFVRLAYTKFEGWRQAANGTSIFVGDDGQGDLVAAQMMMKSGKLLAAFIHDVKGKCRGRSCRAVWAEYGIFLFSDYVDAASIALAHGLISQQSCKQVCQAKGAQEFTCKC